MQKGSICFFSLIALLTVAPVIVERRYFMFVSKGESDFFMYAIKSRSR